MCPSETRRRTHRALCGGERHRSEHCGQRSDPGETSQVLLADGGEPPEDDAGTDEDVLDASDIVDPDQLDGQDGTADQGAGEHRGSEERDGAAATQGGGNEGRDGPGQPAGGYRGGETGIVAQLAALPLQVGGILGALVVAVPSLVVTVVVTVFHERNVVVGTGEAGALDVGAEIALSLLSFGSAARIRDWFLVAADVDLAAVDPAEYPTVSEELATTLAVVEVVPAALLLGLYLVVPYLLFWSGARLASKQAPGETAGDHLKAGMTVVVGALPLVFVLAAVFTVAGFGVKVLVGGIVVPLVFGGAGGLTVWAYDESLRASRLLGAGAILVGLVAALVLVPQASPGRVSMADRLTSGLMGYLDVGQLSVGPETELQVLFVVVVAAAVAAGFLRTWSIRERVPGAAEGAHIGASIAYGFVWPVALLLWLVPILLILTGTTPVGLEGTSALNRSLAEYRNAVVLAGIVLPAVTGAVGGYVAIWYRNQEEGRPPR